MAAHFFVSYSRLDGQEFALELADELEAGSEGYRVWLDKREMRPSRQDWDDQLTEAIQTCEALLFVMTKDSVRVGSGCKDEWVWALRYKKPVIPIRVDPDANLPFRLSSRQFIDFGADFARGLAQLRRDLRWWGTPEGQLRELEVRLAEAERELPRADLSEQPRIEQEMEQLRQRILAQRQLVADPGAAAEQTDARIGAALERERQPERPVLAEAPAAKFVNPPPLTAPAYFQNRHVETGLIGEFLRDGGLRLMSVVGRGGVGKTAMVCRLLKALEGGRLPDDLGELAVDGIVYLSPVGAHPVDFAHVFSDLCRLLAPDVAAALLERSRDPHETPAALMRALLEQFPGGRWVLLLDNFEDVVDADGVGLTDSALEEALVAALRAPQHGVKVILTTRVAPKNVLLAEPGVQRRLNLDEGLPSPFAEQVLRAMDPDGSLGVRNAPDELLAQARERTRGFPRALEALVAILAADRDTTLPELLTSTESMPENVVEALVGEAYNRLDTLAQQVMQALAIYPGPVPPVAVDYLLQPFQPAIDSAPVLGRLVNMQFARRDAGRYYLHQVDRDYARRRVPTGEPTDRVADQPPFSQDALSARAAEYFRQTRTPRETWKNLDDLAPQLAEFELRCQAGDYDTAARVLLEISVEYLQLWGHVRLARDLHERIHDRLTDPWTNAANLTSLGNFYVALGEMRRAIDCFEQALAINRETGGRGVAGAALIGLGNSYFVLGELERAIDSLEQALAINREIGDRRGEGTALTSLGSTYLALGEVPRAIDSFEQALAINREIGERDGEGAALGGLGVGYYALGEVRRAIEVYEQALAIRREIGDRDGEATDLNNLGESYLALGEVPRAIDHLEQALATFHEIGNRRSESLVAMSLGNAHADSGAWTRAVQYCEQGIQIADDVGLAQGSSEGRIILATSYLHAGEFELARTTAEAARGYEYAPMSDNAALVLGIATARQGEVEAAKQAFDEALNAADALLAQTPNAFDELDNRALALCGLALLDDPDRSNEACEAFRAARAITRAEGIVGRVLRLLDVLITCDRDGILATVRSVAAGDG